MLDRVVLGNNDNLYWLVTLSEDLVIKVQHMFHDKLF